MAKKFSKPHLSRIINGDIEVPEEIEAEKKPRLDAVLSERYPQYSRATLQKFIKNGQIKVNSEIVHKPNTLIEENDSIEFTPPSKTTSKKPPVIYEDKNVIVFDKPAGFLSTSKGDFNPEDTLEDYGLPAHRLDRITSGVIIVAKNPETKSFLQKQFQQRKVRKTYYAIVVGHPKENHAIINIPIARSIKNPTTFLPSAEGREAITEYQVLAQNEKYSLLKLMPQTGRTHQLRVHLKYIGTPILGDPIYGEEKDNKHAKRMYLHAESLEITIPNEPNNERKIFTAPLPPEFNEILPCK